MTKCKKEGCRAATVPGLKTCRQHTSRLRLWWRRVRYDLRVKWEARGGRGRFRDLEAAISDLLDEVSDLRGELEVGLRDLGGQIEEVERTFDQALSRIED